MFQCFQESMVDGRSELKVKFISGYDMWCIMSFRFLSKITF